MIRVLLTSILVLAVWALVSAQSGMAPDTTEKKPAAAAKQMPESMKEMPAATKQIPATAAGMEAAEPALTIERDAFCTGVEEREPVGEGTAFTPDVGTLYFWSNVLNTGDETTVIHVWYLNGEEKARVTLPIKYPRNRVWSSKIIPPEWDGDWKVDIVSADGDVLGAATCTVK